MTVGHDAFAKEAAVRSDAEGKRAAKQGFRHAQTDAGNKALLDKRPEVRDLLNIVDLIIAHPDDSTWWRPVLDAAVSRKEAKVAQHIRARNETRGARRRDPERCPDVCTFRGGRSRRAAIASRS